ncbi:alcohol dehydrogenase [Thioclava dalianensis]|uniref:Alcohol dehydrogenase n=1 Tax=Thioclava dalianensis TaxID=1185766 RepID=A0A074TI62_9RHOB|nr:aldo/keto reductase [Thioclava dalianensis]KEP71406.1 alcohol dehydrogenase [Thioclava dalianensis]SFM79302.1 Predicted oxidoreductase [Thioclava dalianensis]
MQRRPLGTTGLSISPIVFGGNVLGWTADEATSFRVLDAFVDHGFDTIDTADVYSRWAEGHSGGESETVLGRWFAARPGMRGRITLFTKVGSDMGGPGEMGLGPTWISQAIDRSLKRLNLETVDLYFSHWPDAEADEADTLGAYTQLISAGKIRAIGASNYDAEQLAHSLKVARDTGLPRYQVIQPEYNLYKRDSFEGPLRDLCRENEIGVVTYFSLAAGFLTGKYRSKDDLEGRARGAMVEKYLDARGERILEALDDVASAKNVTCAEVSLAWLIAREGVSAPIASATSVAQVESFARAATLTLSDEEMSQLTDAGA